MKASRINQTAYKIRGAIFDMDGVLVDTAKYHFRSWEHVAGLLGFKLDKAINQQLKGINRSDSLAIILKAGKVDCSMERQQELMDIKNEVFLNSLQDKESELVMDGVKAFLDDLRQKDIPMAVASSSKNAKEIINKCGLADYFLSIKDSNDVSRSKPAPEVFLDSSRALQLLETECIVFEDGYNGVIAARKGGFRVVGIGDDILLDDADLRIGGFVGYNWEGVLKILGKQA